MTPRPSNKIVCGCYAVTEAEIVNAIRAEGLTTRRQVSACTQAGEGCRSCHPAIREYLAREQASLKSNRKLEVTA